ncbi:unnamed protein product [Tetraodon nigroviridis]|uniref:(spotted green pufferfish) hypothetical protein n=1 Tax=Tetraodon nigroviridis TaxID=99883 RepID=Q4TE49_TETNG|nr:unnamed protein product [Tetraodon nigroviridis]
MKTGQMRDLQEVLEGHKISLKSRCERVTEGTNEAGSGTLLKQIYTELYITEGQSEEVNTQHEVRQLERTSKKSLQDTPIRCQDIFTAFSEQQKKIRVVLTNGVAGVGKTFSVQKFSLDLGRGFGEPGPESGASALLQGAELGQRSAAQSSHTASWFPSNIPEDQSRRSDCL